MKMSFTISGAAAVQQPIDFATLVAGIAGQQAATPTASIAARLAPAPGRGIPPMIALAALVLADRDWPLMAAALKGSFHPDVAGNLAGKARSMSMKPAFTLAF